MSDSGECMMKALSASTESTDAVDPFDHDHRIRCPNCKKLAYKSYPRTNGDPAEYTCAHCGWEGTDA